jgi:4-amino-4-deoxy-L-arabinose transferase-like glycosyltransferase
LLVNKKNSQFWLLILIMVISTLMHLDILQVDIISIHSWRITQTQSTIINFYEEDFNILNPRKNDRGSGDGIFRMEFPLMQWLYAGVYKIFGNHILLSRILSMITGFASVLGIFFLIFYITHRKIPALIGMWAFNFSPSFYFYTVSPLPDNFALATGIWGMAFFFKYLQKNKIGPLIWSGFFLGLSTLSKLPFVLYFSVPLAYFLVTWKQNGLNRMYIKNALLLFAFLIPPALWYAWVMPHWNTGGVIHGMLAPGITFIYFLDLLHHHLISALPELLLNYGSLPFFVASFYFIYRNKTYRKSRFYLFATWGLVLLAFFIFEINMIGKAHDYYLFPFLPLLFLLVGYGAEKLIRTNINYLKTTTILLLVLLPLFAALRMQTRWNKESPGFNVDLLKYKTELRNAIPKNELCVVGNDDSHFIFFYYVDKKGWCFHKDELTGEKLKEMIEEGARYLYSDSRAVDQQPGIQKYLDQLILEKGSIKVYSLK